MKILLCAVIALSTVLSAGCAAKKVSISGVEAFRQSIPNDPHGHQTSMTIFKPFREVAHVVKSSATPCLDREVSRTARHSSGQAKNELTLKYNPTLVINDASAELSVQLLINGGGLAAGETPEKGMYILLADIIPVSEKQTRVTIYRNENYGAAMIEESIKDWVARKVLKCPDLDRT